MTYLEAISIVVGVLVGLYTLFGKPILSLNSTITRLIDDLEDLKHDVEEYHKKDMESHHRLWKHQEEQDNLLHEHEIYIRMHQKEEEK